ncbi:MAG: class I SAM-dependent methyltransferase [Prolixibacteraceae bacterium]|nr:class I SAM-dependent methyltransferase [Prolixibacteraceae bacterium]
MKSQLKYIFGLFLMFHIMVFVPLDSSAQEKTELDRKVERFLENHKYRWHDMNIPTKDGQILYDIIIQNNYKNAIEIGTSTGHSAIWIAWALSKTGGKLITIELNETRYRKAQENFKEAGLEDYIESRLGDAHSLVPKLDGPIDFVFCDADKDWYKNYFKEIRKKLALNGCFVAHNIKGNTYRVETKKFIDYIQKQSDFKTRLEVSGDTGMSISYKIK